MRTTILNVERTPGKRLVARFPTHFGVSFARRGSRLIAFLFVMDAESELRSLSDLEEKLKEVISPFDAMVPDITKEWFTVYSTSRGRTQELLLISALTSTSALIGKTTVKVFGTYEEPGNLLMIAVAPSGSGKTPACQLGCTGPIVGHIEPKINTNILIDITSANGLFNHFVSGSTVPIICIDEANSFLTKSPFQVSTKCEPFNGATLQMFCTLFYCIFQFHLHER